MTDTAGLLIDSFAGGGGASLGIARAFGRPIDVAINHDPAAVAVHKANHPETLHHCKNVWQADPAAVVQEAGGPPVALAWFSPDCKHFSKAKGGRPVKRNLRDLAWIVVLWARRARPRVIMLENVEEFRSWGPVDVEGQPCPDRKGKTFQRWVGELRRLGYRVEWRELRACDFGAPTIRKRLFVVARCDGLPIAWPQPTHGPGLRPYRTAADCIDWSLPCPSIFERKRPLAEATLRRIARGIQRFVIEAAEPFIVSVAHGDSGGRREYGIGEPLGTVTAGGKSHALVVPHVSRQFGKSVGSAMGEPIGTVTAGGGGKCALVAPTLIQTGYGERPGQAPRVPGLEKPLGTVVAGGSKHALVAAFLAQHNTGVTGHDARKPLSTITGRCTQQQLVTSHLVKLRGTCRHGQDLGRPMPTVTAQGTHLGEVRAFLTKYYGTAIGQSCAEPLHTATEKARLGLVTVTIGGADYVIADIGMRMLSPRELFNAQGFPRDYRIDAEVDGKPITKTAQYRLCGNSVCPDVAEALVRANLGETLAERAAA